MVASTSGAGSLRLCLSQVRETVNGGYVRFPAVGWLLVATSQKLGGDTMESTQAERGLAQVANR
jgi:hypothetical protein